MSTLIALIKALPVLKSFFDQLVAYYVSHEIAKMKEENKAAIRKAILDHDQRGIEEKLGSDRAGELSGVPGTEIRDSLPGVK